MAPLCGLVHQSLLLVFRTDIAADSRIPLDPCKGPELHVVAGDFPHTRYRLETHHTTGSPTKPPPLSSFAAHLSCDGVSVALANVARVG